MYPPQNPIAALSSIYGIQQQQVALQQARQNLQTGQYAQQSAQAGAQLDQQKSSEMQAVGNLTKGAYTSGRYTKPDGTFDNNKFANDVAAVAPVNGQAISNAATERAGRVFDNQQKLFNLEQSKREAIGNMAGAVAADATTDPTKATNAVENLRSQFPDDKDFSRVLTSMTMGMKMDADPSDPKNPNASSTFNGLRQQFRNIAVGVNAPSAAQTAPNVSAVGLGSSVAMTQTNPQAIGGLGVKGALPTGIPPGWSLTEDPITHNKYMINQQTGESKPLAGMGGNQQNAPPPRLPGQGESQADVAGADAKRYSQISGEGTNAQTGAQLADQVANLADQVRTGKLSKEWADRLAVIQQHDPQVTDRQMLQKYAAQLKTIANSGSTTDASRDQVEQGMPSPETMDPDAVKQAAQYVGGIFRMRGARQQYADQYVKNSGGPLGMQGADDSYMRSADPTLFAYKALPPGPQRQAFLSQHGLTTPAAQQAFKARINQIDHYSGGQ
jgi:hypothetical protein